MSSEIIADIDLLAPALAIAGKNERAHVSPKLLLDKDPALHLPLSENS